MGAVETPGTYTLSAFSTVFHALYMAGGVSEIGSLRDIRVFRNGRQISTVDIYDYILNGKLSGNIKLSSGDIIIVNPYECLVNQCTPSTNLSARVFSLWMKTQFSLTPPSIDIQIWLR